jgi:hypothetical protein
VLLFSADAAMPMTIPLDPMPISMPTPTPQPNINPSNVVYKMIPKTLINDNGEIERIDNSYSISANPDGTYDLQQNGVNIEQGIISEEGVQQSASSHTSQTTNMPDDGDDGDDDDSNNYPDESDESEESESNPIEPDSDGDGIPDSNDPCPYDPDNECEDEDDEPESLLAVYSISNYEEPRCVICDEIEEDANNEDEKIDDKTESEEETSDSIEIDVKVQFDGSGTLLYINEQEQTEQQIQTSPAVLEIQSEEEQEPDTFSESTGIIALIKSLVELFPTLGRIVFIQNILSEIPADTNYAEDEEAIEEDNDDVTPSDPIIPPEEEIADDEMSDIISSDPALTSEESITADNPEIESIEQVETGGYTIMSDSSVESILEEENIVFLWDFGDGTAGTGVKPVHTYHISTEIPSTDDDHETVADKVSGYMFSMIPQELLVEGTPIPPEDSNTETGKDIFDEESDTPDREINTDEILVDDSKNSDFVFPTYNVNLYVVIDENGVLENIETIDKNILSQVEIIGHDTTTVTIEENTNTLSITPVVGEPIIGPEIGDVKLSYGELNLLPF